MVLVLELWFPTDFELGSNIQIFTAIHMKKASKSINLVSN